MAGVGLAAVALLGLTACGDDDSAAEDAADPASTEPTDVLCDAREELALTIEMLEDVDVVRGGTDAIEQALTDVREAVDDVREAAGADLTDEVGAVRTAFDELEGAVDSLDQADSASAAIGSVSRTVADLAAAVGALRDELRDGCE
jgi:methyl-accepting chemotaxis protein